MRWAALLLALGLSACSSPVIHVRPRPAGPASLAGAQPFRISTAPAPIGCRPLGRIAFTTQPADLHTALMRLRRRALSAGANRVAKLRCGPATHTPAAGLLLRRSRPLKPGQKIYCAGELYLDRGLIRPTLERSRIR